MRSWPSCYEHVFSRLRGLVTHPNGWDAICPAHEDTKPSLSVKIGREGRLILKCHAPHGCEAKAVVDALGIGFDDLFPDNKAAGGPGRGRAADRKFVCAYSYLDENRVLLYQVVRWDPKAFTQRRPNPRFDRSRPRSVENREWLADVAGKVRLVPYRLPDLLAALREKPYRVVFVLESEKAVDRAWSLGLVATCSPRGAGKWDRLDYVMPLRNADVVVCPDNDPVDAKLGYAPGPRHMEDVALSLTGWARRVRWLDLPDLPPKGDFFDWAERFPGDKNAARVALAERIREAPVWTPDPCRCPLAFGVAGDLVRARMSVGRSLASWDEAAGIVARLHQKLVSGPESERSATARILAAVLVNAAADLDPREASHVPVVSAGRSPIPDGPEGEPGGEG